MSRAPPEEFSCNIDVEVDIPYSKLPKLFSLVMKAIVGVHKLHIESNLSVNIYMHYILILDYKLLVRLLEEMIKLRWLLAH